MKKRIFFVFNMHAGKARIKTKLSDILNTFTEKGYEVTAYPTQYAGEAVLRIEALEDGYELVVCSGGDGTLDEVVTGMMRRPEEKRIPIGYIPAGSTNDFAKSLGLPRRWRMQRPGSWRENGSPAISAPSIRTILCTLRPSVFLPMCPTRLTSR